MRPVLAVVAAGVCGSRTLAALAGSTSLYATITVTVVLPCTLVGMAAIAVESTTVSSGDGAGGNQEYREQGSLHEVDHTVSIPVSPSSALLCLLC